MFHKAINYYLVFCELIKKLNYIIEIHACAMRACVRACACVCVCLCVESMHVGTFNDNTK